MKSLKVYLIFSFLFLFVNIFIYIYNLIIFDKIIDSLNKNRNYIKNIDKFIINLAKYSYNNISSYLNNKFMINKKKSNLKKKLINLYTVGSYSKYYENLFRNNIIDGLKDKFIFEFKSENPDYLIYDVFNCEFLNSKYNNSIKIAYFTENQIPDFSRADYAIGFDNLMYLDRYFRRTTLIMSLEKRYFNINNKDFIEQRRKSLLIKKRKFCAAVISNHLFSDGFRIKFIKELNKYKKIEMGGKYMNNIGGPVKNKTKFLSSYKFSIAMENTEGQGYISEKILDSLIAGTIPIYYGGYMIDEFINPKTFILIKDENDMKKKIDYIKKIDNDEKLYKSILKEKLFIDDNLVKNNNKEKIKFFEHIFEQDKDKAKRIDNYMVNYF